MILKILESADQISFFICFRIPVGSQHNADRRVILKLQLNLIQRAVHTGLKHFHDIILHTRQYDLSLRIPESRIVFQDLWPLLRKHQTEENDSLKRSSLGFHRVHSGLIHVFPAEFIHLFRIERARGKGSHAARIKTLVSILRPLVVLSRSHDPDRISIHKRQHRYFAAGHKLLHHDPVTGGAELLIQHQRLDAVLRLFPCIAD